MKNQSSVRPFTLFRPLAAVITFLAATAVTPLQAVNIEGQTYCYSVECKECDEATGEIKTRTVAGTTCPESGSLSWAMKVGVAGHARQNSFVNMSRVGVVEGTVRGDMRNFDEIYAKYYGDDLGLIGVYLELDVPKINADVFDPGILKLHSTGNFTRIDDQGHLKQVLTDNGFTHIDKLAGGGFHIRLWNRQGLTLVKTGNLYNIPAGDPVHEAIFKKPDGVTGDNELLIITKERFGANGVHIVTDHHVQDDPLDKLTVTTHQGEGTAGTVIYKQLLQYSNRGSKVWDYTIERQVFQASTAVNGVMSGLTKVAHTQEIYQDFSTTTAGGARGARRMISKKEDFGGANLTTVYSYYDEPGNPYKHGRLKSVLRPDKSWEYYEYTDTQGAAVATHVKYSSWKDTTLATHQNGLKEETVLSKDEVTRTTSIAGQQISKVRTSKQLDTNTGETTLTLRRWSGTEWATTTTCYHPEGGASLIAGRPKWRENADGTAVVYSYTQSGGDLVISTKAGAGDRNGVSAGIETLTTYNTAYQVTAEEEKDVATGLSLTTRTADLTAGIDGLGRPVKWIYNGNVADYSIMQYGCCGLESSRDRTGATATYYRDALKRVYRVTRKSSSTDTPVDTTTAYTGLTTTVKRSDGTTTLLISESTRTISGLTTTRKSPDADGDNAPETTVRTMTYNAAGGTTTTVTYPDGTTTSSVTFTDGTTKSSTDQESHVTTYDKGTHAEQGGGLYSLTTSAITTQWTKSYRDHLGRSFKTEYPDGAIATQSYHPFTAAAGTRGKLAGTRDPDENAAAGTGTRLTYAYDAEGERTSSTTALPGGQSLVATSERDVVNDASLGVSRRSRSWANGILTSTALSSGDGYRGRTTTLAGTANSTRSVPADGAWTVTTTTADGQKTVQTYSNGQLQKTELFDNRPTPALVTFTTYTYDAFGRTLTTVDARTGTTTVNGYLENGAVVSITANNGSDTTTYAYDKMGRRTKVTLPDNSDTHTSYTARGQTLATWGSQTYARLYRYDARGRMSELRTYQTLAHGTQPTPATAGYASTTWVYDPRRGFLLEKNHHGETDDGTTDADYAYTKSGRLRTRTWERGVVTSYSYQQGMLTSRTYSNDPALTPSVSYSYDSFGRPLTVSQGKNGTGTSPLATTTYSYNAANLTLDTETTAYDTNADGTADFTRVLERQQDALLRPSGTTLKNGATVENTTGYGYGTAGRLTAVTSGTRSWTYSYLGNSYGLMHTLAGPAHTVTNSYESHRDILVGKQNKAGATVRSNFAYTTNNIGQRSALTTGGSAFATPGTLSWGYNGAGEVTTADHSSDNTQDRAFEYDGIGNRKKSANSLTLPGTDNYTTNIWNQYTAITGQPAGRGHDVDGNTTGCALPVDQTANATLVWDGENRLVAVTRADTTTIWYGYDYLGRRISKQVGTATAEYSIYDGWNLIAEYTGTTLKKSYTWGMDLSGSMQGAGGVGGLLSVTEHTGGSTSHYYPAFDGNGNISEYLDSSGTTAAHYEYDTFGNTVAATGPKKDDFAHRFSTKYQDQETGLYYYGYRYYNPAVGRWLSRDPIGENGGYNLYGFVYNSPLNWFDFLGLDPVMIDGVPIPNRQGPDLRRGQRDVTRDIIERENRRRRGADDSINPPSIDDHRPRPDREINVIEITLELDCCTIAQWQKMIRDQQRAEFQKEVARILIEKYNIDTHAAIANFIMTEFVVGTCTAGTATAVTKIRWVKKGLVSKSGTNKPWTKDAEPNSIYHHIGKDGKVKQSAIYDKDGNVIGHVDYKNHGKGAPSGHGHKFPEPGNPASGHGKGKPHIPRDQLPGDWTKLPKDKQPAVPIGQ